MFAAFSEAAQRARNTLRRSVLDTRERFTPRASGVAGSSAVTFCSGYARAVYAASVRRGGELCGDVLFWIRASGLRRERVRRGGGAPRPKRMKRLITGLLIITAIGAGAGAIYVRRGGPERS